MAQLADELKRKHELCEVAITHRIGRVDIGELSVVIAVSAPHRAAALAACQEAIDTLKQTVPLWKKECYEGGEEWQRSRGQRTRPGERDLCTPSGGKEGLGYDHAVGDMTHPGWCLNLVEAAGLKPGERVLVVVDEPLAAEGAQLAAAMKDAGGEPRLELWAGERPMSNAPPAVLDGAADGRRLALPLPGATRRRGRGALPADGERHRPRRPADLHGPRRRRAARRRAVAAAARPVGRGAVR